GQSVGQWWCYASEMAATGAHLRSIVYEGAGEFAFAFGRRGSCRDMASAHQVSFRLDDVAQLVHQLADFDHHGSRLGRARNRRRWSWRGRSRLKHGVSFGQVI